MGRKLKEKEFGGGGVAKKYERLSLREGFKKKNKHRFVQKVAKKIISYVFSANISFLH